jgi:hypothetical protein
VNDWFDSADLSDQIGDAVSNKDFTDDVRGWIRDEMPDMEDEVRKAIDNYDFSDAISESVGEYFSDEADFSAEIREAVDNVNWWDEIESHVQQDIAEQIHEYMDSDEAKEALRSIIKEVVMGMVKDALLKPFRWLRSKLEFRGYFRAKGCVIV